MAEKAKFDRSKPHVNIGTIGHVELMKKVPMLIRLLRFMKNIGRILRMPIEYAVWGLSIVIRKTVTMMMLNLQS